MVALLVLANPLGGMSAVAEDANQSAGDIRAEVRPEDWELSGGDYRFDQAALVVRSEHANSIAILKRTLDGDGVFRATLNSKGDFHWVALQAKGVYRLVVNNQFRRFELQRKIGEKWKVVAKTGRYQIYVDDVRSFELAIGFHGDMVYGSIDGKALISYQDKLPVMPAGTYGLASGWKSNVSWRGISLSNYIDVQQLIQPSVVERTSTGIVKVARAQGLRSDGIYADADNPGIALKLKAETDSPADLELKLILVDVNEKPIEQKLITRKSWPNEKIEISEYFAPPGRGAFKVALYARDKPGEFAWVEDVGSFVVLPTMTSIHFKDNSYFGGHIDAINADWHLRAARKLGIEWLRAHDGLQTGWWTRVQPQRPDQWKWSYDGVQRLIDSEGFSTLGEILWTPVWASSEANGRDKPETAPPENWGYFERFVSNLASHYRKSIRYWEVWNEPHHKGYWMGSAEEYAGLLGKAYHSFHATDENVFVIGGGGVPAGNIDWIEKMLEMGGAQNMDGFSIHYLDPNSAMQDMTQLRSLLDRYGFHGPVWNTEASVPSTSFLDQIRDGHAEPDARYHYKNACYELVRMYMENISNGIERVFYYEQMDPWRFKSYPKPRRNSQVKISGSMWDEGRAPKPIAAAHAALVYALQGRKYRSRIEVDNYRIFIFEDSEGATAVQYMEQNGAAGSTEGGLQLAPPTGMAPDDFVLIDFMGNEAQAPAMEANIDIPISREPSYLTMKGRGAGDVLEQMYAAAVRKQ